jgi:DNA-binding response OmpR family regulator
MKEMEQEKIRFFINVSHEIRTPLTLILSPVEEALKRETRDKWLQKQLKLVQRNALRMLHLVNQVLDYRKAEMGAMKLAVRKVQIQQLTQNIFDLFAELAAQKNIEYLFNSRIDDECIWIDPHYYERILSNLISNALKFTSEKGVVEVVIGLQDNCFYLEVHDSGCGIPHEKQAKIFDRFFQIEENSQGTGVGLSFVKVLVNKHHGKIAVHSILQEGSTFRMTLPYREEDYDKEEKVTQTKWDTATDVSAYLLNDIALLQQENAGIDWVEEQQQKANRKCILVIEDDKDIRSYLIENLSKHYTVVAAENGGEAWQKLQENKDVDLIISDVMMPVMDGIAFCKKLKRNIQTCHIPLILLTAKSEISDQLEGLQIGADDYLSKPFVWSVLSAKITNVFKHKQRTIRHYSNNIEANVVELSTNTLDEELLQKAKEIVIRRMENPDFSVEELSREMGMSRSNLHLKMKAITEDSTIDFIRRVRLSEACRLLTEGKYNAAEISAIIGFTPSYFSTIFKKHKGCLPTEYARKGQNLTNVKENSTNEKQS